MGPGLPETEQQRWSRIERQLYKLSNDPYSYVGEHENDWDLIDVSPEDIRWYLEGRKDAQGDVPDRD